MLIFRLFHTLKYLKPIQIFGRLTFLLKRKYLPIGNPGGLCAKAMEIKQNLRSLLPEKIRFEFLNHEELFPLESIPWTLDIQQDSSRMPKLWRYKLNYFDRLSNESNKRFSPENEFLILDWISKNADPKEESWEPYPISKRIINWKNWLDKHPNIEEVTRKCIEDSIILQTRRLYWEIEFHNQANHLLENLKALFSTAVYLLENNPDAFHEAKCWIDFSAKHLNIQLDEQILPDGAHYERSPMYHLEMLEALEEIALTIKNSSLKNNSEIPDTTRKEIGNLHEKIYEQIPAMLEWLALMTHPDGFISLFNDANLLKGRSTPEPPVEGKSINCLMKDSGYFVRIHKDYYFVLSCGNPSPAYQPGHTHCDMLSFELSIHGNRCIVDTGCGSYQDKKIRLASRTTSAHNVPMIELAEQSDIWGDFRIGKRARIKKVDFDSETSMLSLEMIDQYDQEFHREIIFEENRIRFRDRMYKRRVTGTFCSSIHLSPDVVLLPSDSEHLCLSNGSAEFEILTSNRSRFEACAYFPEFGSRIQSQKLIISNHQSEAIDYVITWKE